MNLDSTLHNCDARNVVADGKFRDMGFGYDANGRMVKATKTGTPDALSVYDASGLRVAERVNDVWRFSIYDIGGKCVAEYGGPPSNDDGGVKYVLQDWQGSTRAVLNNAGFVNARTDYTAFGETIGSDVGLRTSSQGFGASDTLRQKYALTTRDDATGLDHTWFRKNEGQAGRWTSPDPYNGSQSISDPQSFNRYSYVQSQPTNFADPFGLFREPTHRPFDWGFWWLQMFGSWQNLEVHGESDPTGGGGVSVAPPPPDCAEQDFSVLGGAGFTAAELTAIAQTAVGEASNKFYFNEVEYSFATVINRQTINSSLHSALGSSRLNVFNGGTSIFGLLSAPGQYQAYRDTSGDDKVNQTKAQNNGRLPKGYVCDQLMAAKNFASLIASGALSRNDLLSQYPFTNNLGKNRTPPANAFYIDPSNGTIKEGVFRVGDTIFFNVPYKF